MAHLIQLRNRMKAIETTKKITHAMRLISMSSHSRLRNKEEGFREYLKACRTISSLLHTALPLWKQERLLPTIHDTPLNLIILIGGQRGLCGNFNTVLFDFFEHHLKPEHSVFIPLGKKAITFLNTEKKYIIAKTYPDISLTRSAPIAQELTAFIMQHPTIFTSVTVVSNVLKTFFIQKPTLTYLIPFTQAVELQRNALLGEYVWEQSAESLLTSIITQTLQANLQYLIFQSLLAEQAARFISMDSATRNAQRLLDTARLSYNKLRQAKITKELSEITGTL